MELFLIKDHNGLFHPMNDNDREKAAKIREGEDNLFTLKKIRNIRFHRKYFVLIKMAFENQDQYQDIDDFRYVMQMKAGYYKRIITDKGVTFLPKSIAFDKMDADEFESLYEAVWKVLYNTFAFERELFEQELNQFV